MNRRYSQPNILSLDIRSSKAFAALLLILTAALFTTAALAATSLLKPGDVVRVTVYGQPDLTTEARIDTNGALTFPLIGEVFVNDLTIAEAEGVVAAKLGEGGFVRNASVNVFVTERGDSLSVSVTLLGEVSNSGKFALGDESEESVRRLVGLLAMGGGITKDAADHLYLIRQQGNEQRKIKIDLVDLLRNGNIESDMLLNDGDVVLVPAMDVFYVYGEVQRPGRYRLERNMTIMQALSVASGITDQGNEKGIVINRQVDTKIMSIESKLGDQLEPNDVVYVKGSFF